MARPATAYSLYIGNCTVTAGSDASGHGALNLVALPPRQQEEVRPVSGERDEEGEDQRGQRDDEDGGRTQTCAPSILRLARRYR